MLLILPVALSGCSKNNQKDGKLQIITTIFPAYDFARNIAGDKADVSLLLSPGTDPHSFEPTPKDMAKIESCNLFIYNGGESENWIENIIKSSNHSFYSIKMFDNVGSLLKEDENEHTHAHTGDKVEYDEHIWTSPVICIDICKAIKDQLCKLDSTNSTIYENNFKNYSNQLKKLDRQFRNTTTNGKRNEIIFGDRFPFKYLAKEYNLTYYAAFPGCSSQTEPSATTMAKLINKTKNEHIPVVFYIEMSNHAVADTIAKSTGAKTLLFHSCHNLSKDEIAKGANYISLMYKNLDNLKIALN